MKVIRCFFFVATMFYSATSFAQYPVYGDAKKPSGKVMSFMESCYDTTQGEPVLVSRNEFVYNDKGILQERVIYNTLDSNEVVEKVSFHYEDGRLYAERGKSYQVKYAYDNNGKKLAEKFTSDKINYVKSFILNAKGLVLKSVANNADGEMMYSEALSYDDNNRLFRRIYEVPDTAAKGFIAIYTRDTNGNTIGERHYAQNKHIKHSSRFKYDAKNQLIEELRYNASGSFQFKKTYTYVYDKVGNWIILRNKNKDSSYLTVRTIKYE